MAKRGNTISSETENETRVDDTRVDETIDDELNAQDPGTSIPNCNVKDVPTKISIQPSKITKVKCKLYEQENAKRSHL